MLGILRLGAALLPKIGRIAKAVGPAIARTGSKIVPRIALMAAAIRPAIARAGTTIRQATAKLGRSDTSTQIETEPDTGQKLVADDPGSVGSSSVGGATSTAVGPVRIKLREQPSDDYVTYSSLYSILSKYTDSVKSFIVTTLQSLQTPIIEMEKHSLNLLEIVKSWASTTALSQKRARGKNIEEMAESRYRALTDKDILTAVRGKEIESTMGIIERIVKGITGALFVGLGLFGDKFDDILKTIGDTLMDWAKKAFNSLYSALVEKYPLLGKVIDLGTETPEEDAADKAYSKLQMYRMEGGDDPVVEAELEADYLEKQAVSLRQDKKEERAKKYSRAAEGMRERAETLQRREDKKKQPSPLSIFKQKILDPFYAPSSAGQEIQTKTEQSKKRASGTSSSSQTPSISAPTSSPSAIPVYPTQAAILSVPSLSPNSTLAEVNHG